MFIKLKILTLNMFYNI